MEDSLQRKHDKHQQSRVLNKEYQSIQKLSEQNQKVEQKQNNP